MKTTQKRTEHKNHAEKNSSLQYLNELGDKISNSNYRMPKKKNRQNRRRSAGKMDRSVDR